MYEYELEDLRKQLTFLESQLRRNGHLDVQPSRIVRGEITLPHTRCPYSDQERQQFERTIQWAALRKRLRQERGARYENCGGYNRLQAHHRYYFAGRAAWNYALEDFLLLCKVCHTLLHKGVDEAFTIQLRIHREDRENTQRFADPEMDEWEVDKALGVYDDPVDAYDEDNAGDWENEHGLDLGDLAEEDALDDDYEDEYDEYEDEDGWDDDER